jgi:hypothetical protein
MTKNLRRRHLQAWSLLLVILPAGIISGRLVIQKQPVNNLLQPAAVNALPFIAATREKENYTISVRKSNDSTFQLEWINKTVLTFPTATIYVVDKINPGIKNGKLVGRIEARGTYRFSLPNQPINFSNTQLVLYDFIHKQVIDTINF